MPYYRWSITGERPRPGYPKELKTLGDHLKRRRLDQGLTQKEAGEQLGVSPGSVQNWETGGTSIEVRYYPVLIEFLKYNPLPPAETLGQAIRRARLSRGWPRKRLAAECDVDEVTVKRIELGTPGMMTRSWKVVCDALGIPSSQP